MISDNFPVWREVEKSKVWSVIKMTYENVYFINGTAYAGKSTMVKLLAEKYHGIACEENYHNRLLPELDKSDFPGLTYTRDLTDWHDFVRRTPDEYELWINRTSKECEILELKILSEMADTAQCIFVDTNICVETLRKIAAPDHVVIMLAEPMVSVNRFFNRPDQDKQFLYQLMMEESDPKAALENFKQCLMRINSPEKYETFRNSGFHVIMRDDSRTVEETLTLVEKSFGLKR